MLDLFLFAACYYAMHTHLRYGFRRLRFAWKKLLTSFYS
jgi:hypothetical protein